MRRRPFSGSCIMQPLESVGNKDIPVLLYSGRALDLGLLILHTVRHPAVWSAEDETREKKKEESCDCCRQNHNRNPMRIPHEQRRAAFPLHLTHRHLDWSTKMFFESPFHGYPTCLIFAHVVLWSTALWTARTTRRRRPGRYLT